MPNPDSSKEACSANAGAITATSLRESELDQVLGCNLSPFRAPRVYRFTLPHVRWLGINDDDAARFPLFHLGNSLDGRTGRFEVRYIHGREEHVVTPTTAEFWDLIHAERVRLSVLLETLTDDQWKQRSLSSEWTVEEVVAHLTAAANTGLAAWLRSMAFAGFDAEKHNARRLKEHLGQSSQETLENFRRAIPLQISPTKDFPAWLGEVIVHGQDIARPLGVELVPEKCAVQEVATYFAAKDFAVNSKKTVEGLRLIATDSNFEAGNGPEVRGAQLSLVMAMAGRRDYLDDLHGDGLAILESRIN